MEQWANANTDLVVDAYFTAITSWWPRVRYHVGWDSYFVWIPVSMMPSFVQDALLMWDFLLLLSMVIIIFCRMMMKLDKAKLPAGSVIKSW